MGKHVVIAERLAEGHRLFYVRLLVEACLRRGCSPVVLLGTSVAQSDEYARHLGVLEGSFELHEHSGNWRIGSLQVIASGFGAGLLVIPDGNLHALDAAFAFRLRRGVETRLLMMRDPRWELEGVEAFAIRARLKWIVMRLALRRSGLKLVWLREPGYSESGELHANDPVILDGSPEQLAAAGRALRLRLGLDGDTFWYGIAGVLTDSKVSPIVAEALIRVAQGTDSPIGLVLIGPPTGDANWRNSGLLDDLRLWMRVVVDERMLSNYEVGVSICAFDCVVAAYVDSVYGPSSTVGKAVALGVRSVAAGSPSMRRFALQMSGRPGVALNVDELSAALTIARQESPPPRRGDLGPEQFVSALLTV